MRLLVLVIAAGLLAACQTPAPDYPKPPERAPPPPPAPGPGMT